MRRDIPLQVRFVFLGIVLGLAAGCVSPGIRGEPPADRARQLRIRELIRRLGAPGFAPAQGEQIYRFSYSLQKAGGGEVVRRGEGFVLVHGSLWCLVQRWLDSETGNPGQRMLIVDRSERKLEAEVRQWPEGNPRQRWNHWICMRLQAPTDRKGDLYQCEYFYPEGTEQVISSPEGSRFYGPLSWNENGLLEKMTRFQSSFARYYYEDLKLKRIEFHSGGAVTALVDFSYP